MRIVLTALASALLVTSIVVPTTAAVAAPKGQDRSGSQCARKDKDGKTEASGSCGTVCKDKDLTTATGEDQRSGYQYTCKSAALTGHHGVHGPVTSGVKAKAETPKLGTHHPKNGSKQHKHQTKSQ